ncbi:MAG TPA: tetratricopeptide repeat protein [Edaphobacter sp.]|nr:tetratricopeptide repeat protein [Edaphobacter sp.]
MSRTEVSLAKRRLFLRDSLTFLVLTLLTGVLFLITLFLFRSFTSHRAELAVRWSGRGKTALDAGKPIQAMAALHTALSYAPGTRSYELLLAQALADAGHIDEASNYFMNLWLTQPGDGFINLELARLSAKKKDAPNAIKYYRASIYGTWEGDGVVRRRVVRLELARYLIAQHDFNAARIELLIAAGNSPSDPALNRTLADLLVQASDVADGFNYYKKSLQDDPKNQVALEGAGRAAYSLGDFAVAHSLLERAIEAKASPREKEENLSGDLAAMLANSKRILELRPSGKLGPAERVSRIVADGVIARKRFDDCAAGFDAANGLPPLLQQLKTRWTGANETMTRPVLLRSLAQQDAAVQLVFDTELQTSQFCGSPSGDNALLLLLAKSPDAANDRER